MVTFISNEVSTIPCSRCGGKVIEFTVPNDIWNKIIRDNLNTSDESEYICVECWFDSLRSAIGLVPIYKKNRVSDSNL